MQAHCGNGKFIVIGDILLVHDEKQQRLLWRMGKVEDLIKGEDSKHCVRSSSLCTVKWRL